MEADWGKCRLRLAGRSTGVGRACRVDLSQGAVAGGVSGRLSGRPVVDFSAGGRVVAESTDFRAAIAVRDGARDGTDQVGRLHLRSRHLRSSPLRYCSVTAVCVSARRIVAPETDVIPDTRAGRSVRLTS